MKRYHPLLVSLHWLLAVLILFSLFAGSIILADIPNDNPDKIAILKVHIISGLVILILMLLRLFVRMKTGKPVAIDTGDILLQKTLSLEGNISDIVDRITQNNYDLITKIIQGKFIQKKQSGKSTVFKRRQPFESELKSLNHPNQYIYNFVRMLQDPYPNAFLKIDGHKIIFKSAKIKGKNIHFEGVIE